MNAFEIYYIVVIGMLILSCLISFVVIARIESGRGAKIVLAVTTAAIIVIGIMTSLVFAGIIDLDFTASLYELSCHIEIPILTMIATLVATAEFSGVMVLLCKKKVDKEETNKQEVVVKTYPLPTTKRRKDKPLHDNYKIIGR